MLVKRPNKANKPDNREYTFMIVPHHGQGVVRKISIPIKTLKYLSGVLAVGLIVMTGVFINNWYAASIAKNDKVELNNLREVNVSQVEQIEKLAKANAEAKEYLKRVDKLYTEVSRLVNSDDTTGTSRSGVVRPIAEPLPEFNGQGGPSSLDVQDVLKATEDIKIAAQQREKSLNNLKEALIERNARLAARPSIWPTSGQVTSRFGYRSSPWGGGGEFHPGIDIANDFGTPIVAAADGKIIYSDWFSGYGKMVQIDHGHGIVTLYGHCQQLLVQAGETVKKGQLISYMGSTGLSTGSHLHYEVRVNDKAVDPASFLQ